MDYLRKANINLLFNEVNTGLPPDARNILCMTAWGLGDMTVTAAYIHAIAEKYPKAALTVLTHYAHCGQELYSIVPCVDRTIDVGISKYGPSELLRFMTRKFRPLLSYLQEQNFDLVVSFFPNMIRRLLMAGLNSPYKICGKFLKSYPRVTTFGLLGFQDDLENRELTFSLPEPRSDLVFNKSTPLVGIHPFAGAKAREWRDFHHLRNRLVENGISVVVVGEKAGVDDSLVNKLSITDLFNVIRQCDVFVTTDSGPMHIAFSLGIPTVALFPVTDPNWVVSPADQERHTIIHKPEITVDEVCSAVKKLLAAY